MALVLTGGLRWVRIFNLFLLAATLVSFVAVWQAAFYSPLFSLNTQAHSHYKAAYRGVNLGGWLVLEPWITPSLFDQSLCKTEDCAGEDPPVIDEKSFCERLGSSAAQHVLEKHRSTWVTERTFQRLAASGLNIVRIPIGYWLFGDISDFCFGISSVHHLDNAVKWAENHNIQVYLDMHGVVGGANGMDNSGISSRLPFASRWGRPPFDGAQWLRPPMVNRTRQFLRRVIARYSKSHAVVRIGMVNEPLLRPDASCRYNCPLDASEVLDYYEHTWHNLSDVLSRDQHPVLDIGSVNWSPFSSPLNIWEPLSPLPSILETGVFDWHVYHFVLGLWIPQSYHLRQVCDVALSLQQLEDQVLPVMIGEWSLSMTECMTWLQGVGTPRFIGDTCQRVPCPSTYGNVTPGTSCVNGPNEKGLCPLGPQPEKVAPPGPLQPEDFYRLLTSYMMSAYGTSAGWIFWNFKTEIRDPRWSFFDAQERGWFPANLSKEAWRPLALPCETRDSFLGSVLSSTVMFVFSALTLLCCTCVQLCCTCIDARHARGNQECYTTISPDVT